METTQQPTASPAIHLVRHGESTWNAQHLVQGQTDHPELTELGRQQAARTAALLSGLSARRLLTSDLVRARQTAEIISAATGLPATVTALLREQHWGELEGLTSEQAVAAWDERSKKAADAARASGSYDGEPSDSQLRVAGGESLRDVSARVSALLASPWVTEAAGDVIVVSHGDTIRVAVAHLLGEELDESPWREIRNAQVHTVSRETGGRVRYRVTDG